MGRIIPYKMRVIVLGSNGMLGSMLTFHASSILDQVVPLSRMEFNVLTDSLSKLDAYLSPSAEETTIVNCVGAIPQKPYSRAEFIMLNEEFPHRLAEYCAGKGCRLIHVSTNCVFSGKRDMMHEEDVADADDDYGRSKRNGEPTYGTTIRCSIIGPELASFTGLMEWFLHGTAAEVNGYTDSFWNGLTTLELSKVICSEHILHNSGTSNRVIHYYSEEPVSKYTLLTYFSEIFEKDVIIHPIATGLKYYTLSSKSTGPRKHIRQQLLELKEVHHSYKAFHSLK
jgi:dTDP-4-dehydrorhamnose reductase